MADYVEKNDFASARVEDTVLRFTLSQRILNYAAFEVLLSALHYASEQSKVRALTLELSANHCSPQELGDLPESMQHRAPSGSQGSAPIVEQAVLGEMFQLTKPLIAFMSGRCESRAIDLAALCDIRVASQTMKMQDTRILTAEAASTGISYMLPKLIGQSEASRILLLGEEISAEEAKRIHFVHRVVTDDQYEVERKSFSHQIANMATRSWQVHKMQVLGQLHLDFDSAMVHSLGVRQTHVINDRQEGVQAWRERRDPNFTGT